MTTQIEEQIKAVEAAAANTLWTGTPLLKGLIVLVRARLDELEAENSTLAAGACNVPNGLIGDEHGHFYCEPSRQLAQLKGKQS